MGFEDAKSIFIDNKEVQSIVVKDTGGILFQKSNDIENLPVMTLSITGSSFETHASTPFAYTGEVFVDWGDSSGLVEYTGGSLSHIFNDNLSNHTVRVYGNLTGFKYQCFADCTGLTSIDIPLSVTSIQPYCFKGCTGLTSITIPNSIITLSDSCFSGCTGLTSIDIPLSVTSFNSQCFGRCTSLTSIDIPNSVTSLGMYCFSECSSLTSIDIPNSVTFLGNFCFKECIGLTSITVPNSVTRIKDNCFNDCTGLTSIYLNWTETDILTYNSNWVTNTNSNLKFKIPYGTTQLYVDKGYPSDKLEEEIPFNNIVLSADKSVLSYYHNDSCTLTAQLMYDNTPVNIAGVTVTFSTEGFGLTTAQTNVSGIATMTHTIEKEPKLKVDTYTYIIAIAENFESNEYGIENCLYAPNQQYDITRNGTTVVTKLNNDIITDLPSSYTIEFDMKSSNNPTNNSEQRIYWAPNNLWTGTGQPSLAAFAGYCYSSKLEAGRRLNAQTAETNSKTVTLTQWSHIKIHKREDQTYHFFYNDEENEYSYWTLSEAENYTDWIFGIILWSNTTFSIKNLKIKSTVPKVHIDDGDEPEGGAIQINP